MTSDTDGSALGSTAKYLPYVSAFALTSGLGYLWGYWGGFRIKILEHIEISSVVKLAVLPLALLLIMAVGAAMLSERITARLPAQLEARRRVVNRLGLNARLLTLGLIVLAAFAMYYGTAWRWLALVLPSGPVLLLFLLPTTVMRLLPTTDRFLRLVLLSMVAIPVHCFGLGAYQGETIREGTAFEYVVSSIDGYDPSSPVQARLRMIGRAGDYMFLFEPKESAVLMMKLPSDKALVVKSHDGFAQRSFLRKPLFHWGA